MFTLKFSTANAAFDTLESEITKILKQCANHINDFPEITLDGDPVIISDSNGNTVGQFTYTDK